MQLKRTLGFWALVAFGVGDILGAGIYALVGKIAGISGGWAWISFLVAMGVALLTALSYAALGSRFPKSGGEAYFVERAFSWKFLSFLVGWMVLCSGIVSMATVSRAFAGYLTGLGVSISIPAAIIIFLLSLTLINFWGMQESSAANVVGTIIETLGLFFIIVIGFRYLAAGSAVDTAAQSIPAIPWVHVFQGGALAFFAFIGFEDMVNVAEEAKEPSRDLPRAILTALAFAGIIYILIAWLAVQIVPIGELSTSPGPLLEIVRRTAPAFPLWIFTLVALFAVSNTALLNFVMGARLLYGMAMQNLVPRAIGAIHPTRATPHVAILIILAVALFLALTGTITILAGTTSTLLLAVFFIVNISAFIVQKNGEAGAVYFNIPNAAPLAGAAASFILLLFVPRASIAGAVTLLAIGMALAMLQNKRVEQ